MSQIHNQDVRIYSLSSNRSLALEIAKYLKVELDECNVVRFADGEVNLNLKDTARGHHCFIVQSTSNPVNENYMELFIMIDALKRASARTINIIMPYYGYARQDRKALARQPISAKLMADLITVAGATRVLAMDLHAAQIQGFFNIPIDNLVALPVFTSYFKKRNIPDLTIVSPDHGGATRARNFAVNFDNAPLAIIDKRRSRPNVVESMTVIGDVKDRNVIIVDDLVDTAGTLVSAINVLKEAGAKDIYMCATHAVLSGPAIERLQNAPLKELVVTNTIELAESKKIAKIKQISVSKIFGDAILNILDNKAISDLFVYRPETDEEE
ncbi:MAG: ribose-phosphate pyrophosphokinase [Bacilli bacterium]|nr:ribose-phosphate pyrophosphokinase [Bacilli bacterium]